MVKKEGMGHRFGLIGRHISYSFSRGYFAKKFGAMNLSDHSYENFDLEHIYLFPTVLKEHTDLRGLNVTIPYKEAIIPYLDKLSPEAEKIGAVNTIAFKNNMLIGHNTDAFGFKRALIPHIGPHHNKALILGTGGASKAVAFVLEQLKIHYSYVSRSKKNKGFSYTELTPAVIASHPLIINCTPLGTFPKVEEKPKIPYHGITEKHLLFDLIYNPEKTAFLRSGQTHGAQICNGLRMLEAQAERAWEIWHGS